ncbi:GNAT family N-acetyltransferase [Aliagarivorans taiwanensis]|uniref:GNAT family N-acetyltransferase n=1 Tax=Aliagarivorans taiwanensis TaxID=561966 RepID=UPI00040AE3ED|nr:GNAT family N-acetyltransferase [Aliagarivorans taiwanensis]
MDRQEIMRQYNQYERKAPYSMNGQLSVSPQLVKLVSPNEQGSYVSYFELTAATADAEIAKQQAYFHARGLGFEWKTYDCDRPADMGERLLAHGFRAGEQESFMVLDLAKVESPLSDDAVVTEVCDEAGIHDAVTIQEQVWGGSFEWQYHYLLKLKQHSPELLRLYVVYCDGKPVSAAWLTFNPTSPFAGIWGGSTLSDYRGKGYYSALLRQRIRVAKQQGVRYLIIDASEMSRPIVEKYGFELVAKTTGYFSAPSNSTSS